MTHFSLFTGIGGIDLASEWAGFTTVAQCEIDPFCNRVLQKHWPNVPRWKDVHDVTAESVRERGIGHIDLLSFGSPCQDLSDAGRGVGLDGERSGLFFEAIRVARELRPDWLLFENVRGLISRGVDRAISSMEQAGYEVWPLMVAASDVGAPHRRLRLFTVAHSKLDGRAGAEIPGRTSARVGAQAGTLRAEQLARPVGGDNGATYLDDSQIGDVRHDREDLQPDLGDGYTLDDAGSLRRDQGVGQADAYEAGRGEQRRAVATGAEFVAAEYGGADLADAYRDYRDGRIGDVQVGRIGSKGKPAKSCPGSNESIVESRLGSSTHGFPGRVLRWPARPGEAQYEWEAPRVSKGGKDRANKLRAIGNSVSPPQVYPVLLAIAEIERRISADRVQPL